MSMEAIRGLLKRNPDLIKIRPDKKRMQMLNKYEEVIKADYDKLHEIAKEYMQWGLDIPSWRFDAASTRVFEFGRRLARQYNIDIFEVGRLFNEVLPHYTRAGLAGCFISGLYRDIIKQGDVIRLHLTAYPGSIYGIGYRHPRGRLEVIGDRAHFLGAEMEGGEISIKGNVGNYLGKLKRGGEISIEGSARNWVGERMEGGVIFIRGNVRDALGEKMAGGEIWIEGEAGSWVGDDMRGGIIRIKGGYKSLSSDRWGGEIYKWEDGGWRLIE